MKVKLLNLLKKINESKTLAKHISCERRCEFDSRKCNLRQKWNNDNCQRECKKPIKHRVLKSTMPGIVVHLLASVTTVNA